MHRVMKMLGKTDAHTPVEDRVVMAGSDERVAEK
jgi:hypothetical protein